MRLFHIVLQVRVFRLFTPPPTISPLSSSSILLISPVLLRCFSDAFCQSRYSCLQLVHARVENIHFIGATLTQARQAKAQGEQRLVIGARQVERNDHGEGGQYRCGDGRATTARRIRGAAEEAGLTASNWNFRPQCESADERARTSRGGASVREPLRRALGGSGVRSPILEQEKET